MIEPAEALLRLGAATLIGGAIGTNRNLHHKPTGLRTLSLVALGSALVVMAAQEIAGGDGAARVMQGVITGLGFLCAGVIVQDSGTGKVHGLTTAAAIWVTACLGILCALGAWFITLSGVSLIALVLTFGGHIEKRIHRNFKAPDHQTPSV